jgi:hypothetical protein
VDRRLKVTFDNYGGHAIRLLASSGECSATHHCHILCAQSRHRIECFVYLQLSSTLSDKMLRKLDLAHIASEGIETDPRSWHLSHHDETIIR